MCNECPNNLEPIKATIQNFAEDYEKETDPYLKGKRDAYLSVIMFIETLEKCRG